MIKTSEHSFIQGILVVQDTKTRPYVASAGIEDGIQYVHSMKPLMSKIPTPAKFVEANITIKGIPLCLQYGCI